MNEEVARRISELKRAATGPVPAALRPYLEGDSPPPAQAREALRAVAVAMRQLYDGFELHRHDPGNEPTDADGVGRTLRLVNVRSEFFYLVPRVRDDALETLAKLTLKLPALSSGNEYAPSLAPW